jgi:hypothetical protein
MVIWKYYKQSNHVLGLVTDIFRLSGIFAVSLMCDHIVDNPSIKLSS